MVTPLLSLPSVVFVNTIVGLRGDLPRVIRALLATQAGLTIILASLAPFTAFFYLSVNDHEAAIRFNRLWMRRLWISTYVFVGVQMGWVLRLGQVRELRSRL